MKKFLLSCTMLFAALSSQAKVGDDLTSKYLQNADFSAGTVVDNGICTYDYDMEKNSTTYYGQQAVEGWTALNLSDNTWIDGRTDQLNARAAGLFGLSDPMAESNPFLGGGGYVAPEAASDGSDAGQVLGLIAVWGSKIQYTQDVTLPAGCYTITIPTYNAAGTGAVSSNLFGFIAEDGTSYTCPDLTWGDPGVWTEQTVTFILSQETKGVISLGFVGPAGSGSMPHLFIDYVKITEGDAAPIIQEQVDALKEKLLPLLEDGDELGVDTRAGWAVYNNDNATIEEVENAIAVQKENNEKGMTDFTDYFINNAHFDKGTPLDAGVCTYDYDMPGNNTKYFGMQAIEKWTASSLSDNVQKMANSGDTGNNNTLNSRASGLFAVGSGEEVWLGSAQDKVPATKATGATEGNVFGFISVWGGTAYYTQHVTLPAGAYTITIPTYNERGTGAIAKNLCGFIADDGTEYLATTTTFPQGTWSNETIKFALDEDTPGVISIGYQAANAGSASMPHLFIDEFVLKFNGVIDESASLIALRGTVSSAEEFDAVCETSIKERLAEAIDAASDLVYSKSDDDEANINAATLINNLMIEANASAAVYKKFADFIDGELTSTIEKYADGDLSDLSEELSESLDEYRDAYENGEYTTEQINEIMSGLKGKVAERVKLALEAAAADGEAHNLDISILFTNIDYAKSTVEGWQNETGTSAFLSRVQTAEVWNQSSFNVYQTLADMPAGAYEISAPGFYRTAENVSNYQEWLDENVSGKGYLYAGGNKVLMHNVAEYAAEQDDNHTAAVVEGELYVPNSNNNANYVFYTQQEAMNTVTTALVETGDLTIGVKGEGLASNAWVVWGGFTVTYKGAGEELILAAMDGEIQGLIDQATELSNDGIIASVEKSVAQLDNAIKDGEDVIGGSSIDDKTDAINALKDAIAYAKESTPLIEKLMDIFNLYVTLLQDTDIDSDDNTLTNLLDNEIVDPEEGAPSNERIKEWFDELPAAWIKYVMGQSDMKKATEKTPADVTPAIMNPGFQGVTSETAYTEFWSVTKDGGNEGSQFGIYEFYNNNSFDIHQTIEGLTPGYYRVMVQSFYRAGDNAGNATMLTETPDSINHAQLYANDNAVNLKNVLDLTDIEESGYVAGSAFGVNGEVVVDYKGNAEYTIPNNRESLQSYFEAGCYWNQIDCQVTDGKLTLGLRKESSVASDWCPYDNFQLLYLGTTAPTAIESVSAEKAASTAIFDLQGRQVVAPAKGLYIKSGKVVLVK